MDTAQNGEARAEVPVEPAATGGEDVKEPAKVEAEQDEGVYLCICEEINTFEMYRLYFCYCCNIAISI